MNTTLAAPSPTKSPSSTPPGAAGWTEQPRNRLLLGAGAAATLLVAGAILVFFSGRRKEQFAARALSQAMQVAETGNLALASSDLQKVVSTYAGAPAAQQATIVLNQIRMINGQQELAISGLQDFLKGRPAPAPEYVVEANGLLGAALENANRPAEAAEAYLAGAKAAKDDFMQAELLSQAGRAFRNAGNTERAVEVYRMIVKDHPKSPSLLEAQARLAEITKGAM